MEKNNENINVFINKKAIIIAELVASKYPKDKELGKQSFIEGIYYGFMDVLYGYSRGDGGLRRIKEEKEVYQRSLYEAEKYLYNNPKLKKDKNIINKLDGVLICNLKYPNELKKMTIEEKLAMNIKTKCCNILFEEKDINIIYC